MQPVIITTLILAGAALLVLVARAYFLIVRDTRSRSGRWGINRQRASCPHCHSKAPLVRFPKSLQQFWWGGWTCKECGRDMDKWGVEITSASSASPAP